MRALDLVAAVLFSALLHALWNSFVKVGRDRLASVAVITRDRRAAVGAGGLLVPLPGAGGRSVSCSRSVSTHLVYYYCLINAYRFGDLSRVYPLARGLAPPLVAIGAALVAGEWLSAARGRRRRAGLVRHRQPGRSAPRGAAESPRASGSPPPPARRSAIYTDHRRPRRPRRAGAR